MTEPATRTVTMPMVKLAGISRQYGTVAPVVALRGIDLEVHAGEWVAVVGASGSRKTTLLNIVGCLDRQSGGTYWFDGIDVAALDDRQRAGLRSRRIGSSSSRSICSPTARCSRT